MAISYCKNCNSEFKYYPSQSSGIFCSNKCQGQYTVKTSFTKNSKYSGSIRKFLLEERGYECEECGITEWNNKPITFQVDHIDGNVRNNTKENLKILCPNCHTQTPTWGVKNISHEGRNNCRTNLGGILSK